MRPARSLRSLAADQGGATIVEFVLVVPVLAMTIMGLFDMAYGMYVSSVLQGTLHEAARMATVGTITGTQIDTWVKGQLAPFTHTGDSVTVTEQSYSDFAGVKMPEKITVDTAPIGTYNVGDCYEDANGNGQYDLDRGKTGLGQAEDVVNYTVTITYKRLFPVASLLGWAQNQTITGSTMLQNQPFAARATGVTIKCN